MNSSIKANNSTRIRTFVGFCAIATALWCANWYLVSNYVPKDDQGSFGDMFGAVNALFTALAFGGLIYTVLLQRDQIALQQQAIIDSGQTQRELVQEQIEAQNKLFEGQKSFQEELRQKQVAHEIKMEDLRQKFDEIIEDRRRIREQQKDEAFTINILKAIRCELAALDETYYSGLGSKIENLRENEPLTFKFVMTEDYYTVFNANAVHLGKINPNMAKQITKIYLMIKGLVENLKINNTLLDDWFSSERSLNELQLESLRASAAFKGFINKQIEQVEKRMIAIKNQLIERATTLKNGQSQLKSEFKKLSDLFDAAKIE